MLTIPTGSREAGTVRISLSLAVESALTNNSSTPVQPASLPVPSTTPSSHATMQQIHVVATVAMRLLTTATVQSTDKLRFDSSITEFEEAFDVC